MIAYQLHRSDRRTLALEISADMQVIVRAPKHMRDEEITRFVERNTAWIIEKMALCQKRNDGKRTLSPEEIRLLKQKTRDLILPRVQFYAEQIGVKPSGIKITAAQKRFGSCSARGSLCFSCLLAFYPIEAIDYVVVHELTHILHHNHGPMFYAKLAHHMPDYPARQKILSTPWYQMISAENPLETYHQNR